MSTRDKPSVLHSVANLLERPVAKDRLLRTMVDRVVAELDAERGTLFLVDARSGELVSRVAHLPELTEIRLPPGKGVAGHVAQTGDLINLPDVTGDKRFFPGIDKKTGFVTRSMLVAPVRDSEGTIRGVLQVLNRRTGRFGEHDEQLLVDLAEQVSQALERTSIRPVGDRSVGLLLDGPFNNIIGECPQMLALYERILAAASADATVLVRGESGTGKTLVAKAVHDNSDRHTGPFVHVDCTTLPAGLIESELFGHERGAFTGADSQVPGKFELAEGGTLFLDEIGDLPIPLQGKLLRFLQEHEFERVGGREILRADVRVVSATNADLEAAMGEGRFRRDLYYRLRVVELTIPPLKTRGPRDIESLAEHFLDLYARRYRRPYRPLSPEAMARLQRYDWPGNVRELEHCIESAVVLCREEVIDTPHLALPGTSHATPSLGGYPPGTPLIEVERDHLLRTLESCGHNRSEAARLLGIGRNTLARKLAKMEAAPKDPGEPR
ncbi:MAG: sigma-54-dependent Fis family transcriptional regulator [Deltaproteobacteria bacterium]|nr:sigma-54-dependent Fis family transcriptional regulator [Deltaproteobacteria bacterium]